MTIGPYREPETRQPEPRREPTEAERLGELRLTCAPFPLRRALLPAIAVTAVLVVIAIVFAASGGLGVLAVLAPFAALAVAVVGYGPLRARHLRVELHAGGVVVWQKTRREVTIFDEVDEVWMNLESSGQGRSLAMVTSLKLVCHDGTRRVVPTSMLQEVARLARSILLHCSHPLQAQAVAAVRAGETLTFGTIQIDSVGIRGRWWAARWDELSLVRLASGRIHLFRWQRFIPFETIRIDRVPHPTVLIKVIQECARKVESDDMVAQLGRP